MENKTSKYFKYAIGEIVLVVIGILIALQLNTWRENKKQVDLGHKYLTEMKVEVQNDVFMLAVYTQRLTKNIKNHEAALHTKNIATLPLDSLTMIITTENLDFNISELTNIKMKNLGISSLSTNDELNIQITNYYNNRLAFLKRAMAYVFEDLKKYLDYFNYQQDAIDNSFNFSNVNEFPSLYTQPKEIVAESNRESIIKFILSTKGRNLVLNDFYTKQYSLSVLKGFQKTTENLLKSIHKELKEQDATIEDLPLLPSEANFKEIKVSKETLKQYVGKYQSESDAIFNITQEDNQLFANPTNQRKIEIFPYEVDKFFLKDFFIQIHFNRKDNKTISLTIIRNGETEYKKIE